MITNSTGIISCERNINLANGHEGVWVAVGLGYYPRYNLERGRGRLQQWAGQEKVVAIGEVGLDFRTGVTEEKKKEQINLFEIQLQVAQETNLPVEIHNRLAGEEILQSLSHFQVTGVMHGFSQTIDFLHTCLARGLYISIGGMVTYKNSKRLKEVVRLVPEDKLLLETDAPYLAPEPVRGSRNEPANLIKIAEVVAAEREVSLARLKKITTNNVVKLFGRMAKV